MDNLIITISYKYLGILKDNDKQNYPFCRLKILVKNEKFDHYLLVWSNKKKTNKPGILGDKTVGDKFITSTIRINKTTPPVH